MRFQHSPIGEDCPDAAFILISCGQQHPIQANTLAVRQHVVQHLRGISLFPFRWTHTVTNMPAPCFLWSIRAMLYTDHTDNLAVCCTHIQKLGIMLFMFSDISEPFLRILAVPEPPCSMQPVQAICKLFLESPDLFCVCFRRLDQNES